MECNHRKLFLMKKRKLVIKKCILGIYLLSTIIFINLLYLILDECLFGPLTIYILLSSFIVFVCSNYSHCCVGKRIFRKPLPNVVTSPIVPFNFNKGSFATVIFINLAKTKNNTVINQEANL